MREKANSYITRETVWKKFHWKKQKIFFCTIPKFQKISTLNICGGTKYIYPKKQKMLRRKDTLRISEAVVWRCSVKKEHLRTAAVGIFLLKHIDTKKQK